MKLRTGFVSNSSSCSFCIVGIYKEKVTPAQRDELDKLGLYHSTGESDWEDGSFYVGLDIELMPEDMTMKQFKELSAQKLKTVFGQDYKPSIITKGWYNG